MRQMPLPARLPLHSLGVLASPRNSLPDSIMGSRKNLSAFLNAACGIYLREPALTNRDRPLRYQPERLLWVDPSCANCSRVKRGSRCTVSSVCTYLF